MKNLRWKIAYVFALTALTIAGAAMPFATATAGAETQNMVTNGLISPTSYEEYLPLASPTGVAVNADYTAIADGTSLYVYDGDEYRKYDHGEQISRLQFDEADNLYFSDSSATLYALSLPDFVADETVTAQAKVYSCSAFVLNGNELYYTTVVDGLTTIYQKSLSSLSDAPEKVLANGRTLEHQTPLSYANERLYFLEYKTLKSVDPATKEETLITNFPTRLKSMLVNERIFTCVTDDGDFFVYNFSQLEAKDMQEVVPVKRDNGGYASLCIDGDHVYAAQNAAIKQYSVLLGDFTEKQICSTADEPNRLNGATQVFLQDETLYIADGGNARISVYDTATKTYKAAIACDLPVSYMTSDGETLLVASKTQAYVYGLQADTYGQKLATLSAFEGNLVGAAAIYGTYYFATDRNFFYAATQSETEWTLDGTSHLLTHGAKYLTADAQGYLYVICGNDVVRFDETQFLASDQAGERLYEDLPAAAKTLIIDYDRNVYAVGGNDVYKLENAQNGYAQTAQYTLDVAYVYGGEGYTPDLTSLTFGIKENRTYLLYDNNYVAVTDELALPTVKTIPTASAADIFVNESVTVEVVKTDKNAFLVEFDLPALQDETNTVFAYISHSRANGEKTALKLGEADDYNLIAVFDETQKAYHTYLVKKSACTPLQTNEFQIVYGETEQRSAYLTNDVYLYKFPYLNTLLNAERLTRGAKVTLLGEITELDYDYYHVLFEDANGSQKTGYIPKVFATLFEGTPPTTQTNVYGDANASLDSIWRLAYLCLGFGAICILVDYLLIRKDKNTEADRFDEE